jgi:hypothetical protein
MFGGDTAALRIQNLTNENVELFLQEEQSKDSEVSHAAENIGYVAISAAVAEQAEPDKKITLSWEFDTSKETTINGFRIYNNDQEICETNVPSERQITCESKISNNNLFSVVAIEKSGNKTALSNTISYTP